MEKSPRDPARPALPPAGSLKAAMRKARVESAEQSEVVAELRGAEIARLEMLQDALAPLFAQVPGDIDLFDTGLVPGERPRLFIDMLAFVEMGRDRRLYRLVQDTRHGRLLLAESEQIDPMVEAVTDYVARRLVEREKALAADGGPVRSVRLRRLPRRAGSYEPPWALGSGWRDLVRLLADTAGAVLLGLFALTAFYFAWWHWR